MRITVYNILKKQHPKNNDSQRTETCERGKITTTIIKDMREVTKQHKKTGHLFCLNRTRLFKSKKYNH